MGETAGAGSEVGGDDWEDKSGVEVELAVGDGSTHGKGSLPVCLFDSEELIKVPGDALFKELFRSTESTSRGVGGPFASGVDSPPFDSGSSVPSVVVTSPEVEADPVKSFESSSKEAIFRKHIGEQVS